MVGLTATSTVHIGNRAIDEQKLDERLNFVRRTIKTWAARRQLWHDAAFLTPYVHRNECPRRGDVLLLSIEGPLYRIFGLGDNPQASKYEGQFSALLDTLGFEYEMEDHITMSIFPADDGTKDEYLTHYRWQWLQQVATTRLFEVHTEVFEYFAKNPGNLRRLSWRQFEVLLDAIFKNQGFYTELGPGGNDGGVDLRLYQSQAVPELATIVQARRYARRPIGLESVAALFGIAVEQRSSRGIFATTSRFLPGAKKFALSTQRRLDVPSIELADANRIGGWCAEIAQQLTKFFSNGESIPRPLRGEAATPLAGTIVVAQGGYNTTENYFALVEFDFRHEVVLRPIGSKIVSGDEQVGSELPNDRAPVIWTHSARFVAVKSESEVSAKQSFWGDRKLFLPWDGTPQHFNKLD
jgi:hypothetical protein